ncbi:MAG: class I SAM-dependent methyltransferase [Clostridia bacterium]|nr:class I SAM-dependent methyltransferase [Clostridia bacterium]
MVNLLSSTVKLSHEFLEKVVRPGQTVVDATVGNGYDTVFLAELVGEKGIVYGFDIQDKAIKATQKRLIDHGLQQRVVLINDGHQNIGNYINTNINGVLFNLGYLPGGDRSIITLPENTIRCIDICKTKLDTEGIIVICLYTGHDGGLYEKKEIIKYVKELDSKEYSVLHSYFVNKPNNPPELIIIQKK